VKLSAVSLTNADLIVYRLDELEFFFQRLTLILRVNVLQCLIVQILMHRLHHPALLSKSRFYHILNTP